MLLLKHKNQALLSAAKVVKNIIEKIQRDFLLGWRQIGQENPFS